MLPIIYPGLVLSLCSGANHPRLTFISPSAQGCFASHHIWPIPVPNHVGLDFAFQRIVMHGFPSPRIFVNFSRLMFRSLLWLQEPIRAPLDSRMGSSQEVSTATPSVFLRYRCQESKEQKIARIMNMQPDFYVLKIAAVISDAASRLPCDGGIYTPVTAGVSCGIGSSVALYP